MALLMSLFSLEKPVRANPAPQQQVETPMATDERLEVPGW